MDKTEGCKVLVIHHMKSVGEIIQKMFDKRGDEVLFASDGQQALDIAERDRPDLIFVYPLLPNLDGFEFYERLKKLPIHSETPVVFYWTRFREEMNEKIRNIGAAGYLMQPFTQDELIEVRDTVLRGDTYFVSE